MSEKAGANAQTVEEAEKRAFEVWASALGADLMPGFGQAVYAHRETSAAWSAWSFRARLARAHYSDARRLRWLTADHADPVVRKRRDELLARMSVMSTAAVSAQIDLEMATPPSTERAPEGWPTLAPDDC